MGQQPSTNTRESKRARGFFVILFFIFILFFQGNSTIQTILALLGAGIFAPVFDPLLETFEQRIIEPLEHFLLRFFRTHLPALVRWLNRHRQSLTIIALVITCIAIIAMTTGYKIVTTETGLLNDDICLNTYLPWFTCSSGYGVSPLPYGGIRIGLIGGTSNASSTTFGPFDQSLSNQDEIQIEGLIFRENQRACIGQHITLIAVVTLSRTVEDPLSGAALGVQNLRGYYLEQQKYNATHPSTRLCLAIANLGTPSTADQNSTLYKECSSCYSIPQILHQIAQLARFDPSVRGIVGFPLSQQVAAVLAHRNDYLSLARLPIISPTASSDAFSMLSNPYRTEPSNFYRMDAPDQLQGKAIAQYVCSHLVPPHFPATIAVLTDGPNAYSGDIATDFYNNITNCRGLNVPASIPYVDGDRESIQTAVNRALKNDHANYLFFPGYDEDLDTIQLEIHQENPSQFFAILGGDGLNNVDATTTHYAYYPVYAASFAQPLPLSDPFAQRYMQERFSQPYYYHSCLWIPKDTLLANDAVEAFTQTLQQNPGQTDLAQLTKNLASVNFQGESGPIWLQGNQTTKGHASDRIQESIYITSYDQNHRINLFDAYMAIIDTGNVQEEVPAQQCSI